ncbi:MAG: hypothetical protein U0234_24955 [Sandaracinus sp.]
MRKLSALFVVALLGCGGGSSSGSTESSGGGDSAGGETATTTWPAWDDMTQEQRGHYMAEVVVPAMQPIFQERDATRYADFGCATCHGANAHDVAFHMPNGIHPLTHADITATFQSTEPSATWMTQRVWPEMARLIGEPQFNPETGEGFSCMNCHANAEAAATATP